MNETDGGGEVKAIKDGDGDKDTSEKEGDKEKPGACDEECDQVCATSYTSEMGDK